MSFAPPPALGDATEDAFNSIIAEAINGAADTSAPAATTSPVAAMTDVAASPVAKTNVSNGSDGFVVANDGTIISEDVSMFPKVMAGDWEVNTPVWGW